MRIAAATAILSLASGVAGLRQLRLRTRAQVNVTKSQTTGVFWDGYSRAACETDKSPADQRLYFKEHACAPMPPGSSCRLQTLGMTPDLCFGFCRQHKDMHFFGIQHGRDCYCTNYFHAKSTGGGECNLPCEGDSKEKCGGPEKSSLFEMHFCDAAADRAKMAEDMVKEAKEKGEKLIEEGNKTYAGAKELVEAWQLGVCSVEPEGKRVCALPEGWQDKGSELNKLASKAEYQLGVADGRLADFKDASEKVSDAGDNVTGAMANEVDKALDFVKDSVVDASMATDKVEVALKMTAGPLKGEAWDKFEDMFEPLGNVKEDWYAICALVGIPAASYMAVGGNGPSTCAEKCFGLITGTGQCVAFNYQEIGDLQSCQLLTEEGLTKPAIQKAVPIFEMSKSKRDKAGLKDMGCYAKKVFMSSHPSGALKTTVVRQITVDR